MSLVQTSVLSKLVRVRPVSAWGARLSTLMLGLIVVAVVGCTTKPRLDSRTGAPGTTVAADYADLPGWQEDDLAQVWPAFMRSCQAMRQRSGWRAACSAAHNIDGSSALAVRQFFMQYFEPRRVINDDGSSTGLVTGYYEPLLNGSRMRKTPYTVPLYGVPNELLKKPAAKPYLTRAELVAGSGQRVLQGKEIVWVDDVIEAFFLQIQGSGRIQLDGGEVIRVGYADSNGHPYRSIGRVLIERGELRPDQASMQAIKAWAQLNTHQVDELLNANPSYVFFREQALGDANAGPVGALGIPLTPRRSLAVDPRSVPLGVPVFLATTEPLSNQPLRQLMMAQDTGGAIKGGVRADFFWGFGADAGEQAGRMRQSGQMWMLQPKVE